MISGASRAARCDGWPLVGREEEFALAREVWAAGHGVVLAGVAGVGKSRLATELAEQLGAESGRVVRIAATRSAAHIPLGAFGALVPAGGATDVQTINAVVTHVRDEIGAGLPVMLVVEDAHLLDDVSAALLHRLTLDGLARPVVTVRSHEPCADSIVSLWKDGGCRRMELQPLSEQETARLVEYALPGAIDEAVVQRLWRLTNGHPMLLRELVRGIVEDGSLAVRHGVWTWSSPLSVAPALVDLLNFRLSSMDAERRAVLELVAFAEPLASETVCALRSDHALDELVRASLLLADDDGRVRLAHPLVGEIVRAAITPSMARRLSAQLAHAHPEPLDDAAAELRRVVWHVDAGVLDDPDSLLPAIRYAQLHDVPLACRLAEAAVRAGAGIETRLRLADILTISIRLDEAEEVLAAIAAEQLDDRVRIAVASMRATGLLWALARPSDARAVLDEAEAALDDPSLASELAGIRLQALLQEGRVGEVAELVDRVLDTSHSSVEARAGMYAPGVHAWLLAGQFDAAIARCRAGLEETRGSADIFPIRDALWFGLTMGRLFMGELDLAEAEFAARRKESAAHDDVALRFLFSHGLGRAALLRGRNAQAAGYLAEALVLVQMSPDLVALSLGVLAQAQALCEEPDDAQASVDQARAQTGSALYEPDRARADALISWARGEQSRAATASLDAVDLALELGQRLPALLSAHDAARFGAAREAQRRLERIIGGMPGLLAPALAADVDARVEGSPEASERAASMLEAIGCFAAGSHAASRAAAGYEQAGRRGPAGRERARAAEMAARAEQQSLDAATSWALLLLTPREREVAALASRGGSDRIIAATLGISIRTVQTHLHHVYSKLGLEEGRADLVALPL